MSTSQSSNSIQPDILVLGSHLLTVRLELVNKRKFLSDKTHLWDVRPYTQKSIARQTIAY